MINSYYIELQVLWATVRVLHENCTRGLSPYIDSFYTDSPEGRYSSDNVFDETSPLPKNEQIIAQPSVSKYENTEVTEDPVEEGKTVFTL